MFDQAMHRVQPMGGGVRVGSFLVVSGRFLRFEVWGLGVKRLEVCSRLLIWGGVLT
jgi:hypothetical protein